MLDLRALFYFLFTILFFLPLSTIYGQYDFKVIHQVDNTPVKSQGKTGTCWSFATVSFLESELLRKREENADLSEMWIVRNVYKDKARNYILRQGKANFSEGALAHDMLNAANRVGVVPENVYSGMKTDEHNHKEMFNDLKTYLDTIIARMEVPQNWEMQFDSIIDNHLGIRIDEVLVDEKKFTAPDYMDHLGLVPDHYVNITSYTHHPFGSEFVLEIPDNYSNQSYLNMPIERLESLVDKALTEGHSVVWDGDVSEKGFAAKRGLAINPIEFSESCFDKPCAEKEVSQEDRQMAFETYSTTDDHLMHMVGIAESENGEKFYIIKNSWGEISDYKGYIMMSRSYFLAQTVAVTLNASFLEKENMNE